MVADSFSGLMTEDALDAESLPGWASSGFAYKLLRSGRPDPVCPGTFYLPMTELNNDIECCFARPDPDSRSQIARHQGRIVDGLRLEKASGTTSAEKWVAKSVTSVLTVLDGLSGESSSAEHTRFNANGCRSDKDHQSA